MRKFYFHRIIPEQNIDTWEHVLEETWQWEAHYDDGTVLKQFDDTQKAPEQYGSEAYVFHQVKEIDQTKLHVFKMVNPQAQKEYTLIFNPQYMKLVHFYRHPTLNMLTPAEIKIKLYCFGYKILIKRPGEYGGDIALPNYNVITPTDELIITDDIEKIVFA